MRGSNRGRSLIAGVLGALTLALGACTSAATPPPPSPTPAPTPVITPDPHLVAPAAVDDVFRLLGSAGVRITPNTATSGRDGEPVKRINATYASWPLVLTEFTSAAALRKVARFDPARPPARGEAPFIVAGLNILVEYGPRATDAPAPEAPSEANAAAMAALVTALDPLLGPLQQRAVAPVPLPSAKARASASPAATAP